MINITKLSEGLDYEFVIPRDVEDDQAWEVKILTGYYTETIIRYGAIRYDGRTDGLTFDFAVIFSPIEGLSADEDQDLQSEAGDILYDILDNAAANGSLRWRDVDGNDS